MYLYYLDLSPLVALAFDPCNPTSSPSSHIWLLLLHQEMLPSSMAASSPSVVHIFTPSSATVGAINLLSCRLCAHSIPYSETQPLVRSIPTLNSLLCTRKEYEIDCTSYIKQLYCIPWPSPLSPPRVVREHPHPPKPSEPSPDPSCIYIPAWLIE